MRVIMKSRLHHENPNRTTELNGQGDDSAQLRQLLLDSIQGDKMCENADLRWKNDGTVEIYGVNNNALHRFALECEKSGKNISFERQTIIHVS